jgi:predicted nucleic acid-binding protein
LLKLREGIKGIYKGEINDFETYLPSICFIEAFFKLIKEYKRTKRIEILNRYPLGISTILTSRYINIFNPYLDITTSEIAIKIRHAGHPDMFDCWVAASAASLNGILLTEDDDLKQLLKLLPETKFLSIWSWNDFLHYTLKD